MSQKSKSKAQKKAEVIPLKSVLGKCPLCRRPTVVEYRPFCSKRCADKDLGLWLNESYRFETEETPETQENPADEPYARLRDDLDS
ncbi:MAG: DNA gyrase inhibitor YacG [Rhodospirillales bacterium]|jgi:endogenous inhibitor of DNA gyrase (YacG/DUF329 family)